MAARPQVTHYPPEAATCLDITQGPMCTSCNSAVPYSHSSCCTSATSSNSSDQTQPCSSYCNSSANTVCTTAQAYCSIGHQVVTTHADFGAHPTIECTLLDELIFRNWTAEYWNLLMDNIDTAELLGKTVAQGAGPVATVVAADPCNDQHPPNSLVTAEKYNQIRNKIARFNTEYDTVEVGDVIRGTHAAAIVTGYAAMNFNTNVCDICNTAAQSDPKCDCNCDCPCDCSCGCSCPCSCDCDCDCNCSSA